MSKSGFASFETWGHWLDVALCGEFQPPNFNFPQAWRYRGYVIAAFNADKPFISSSRNSSLAT